MPPQHDQHQTERDGKRVLPPGPGIDFPEGIRVLGMCTGSGNLDIGMEVETTVGMLYEDTESEHITYMFRPVNSKGDNHEGR